MESKSQAEFAPTLLVRALIEGRERPENCGTFSRKNPAVRDDVVAIVPICSEDQVVEACAAARRAHREWARVPVPERARFLLRLGQLLVDSKEPFANFVAREVGKPLREARGSVQEVIDTAEFFAGEGRRFHGQTVPSELRDKDLFTLRRPLGVVGVLTAGNFPLAVPAWKIIPALLCGNAVVWKPSEDASGCAALLAQLFMAAGLPRGLLNVIYGGGEGSTGQYLLNQVAAGGLDTVAFTGSTEVGRKVGEICGRQLQRPVLELGGKNPLVILADADLDLAVEGALWSAFGTAGQRCTSAGNLIVDQRVFPLVRENLLARTRELRIGDPRDERSDLGPLINERFLEKWVQQRAIGLEDGAELLLDGRRINAGEESNNFTGDARRGLYASPRIFERVRPEMRVAQAECFGPTVNLIEVNGLEEAIGVANAIPYALSAAIYTRDARAMRRFREESNAGMVSINNSTSGAEVHMPFGGNGWSGNGQREGGIWVLEAYTRWQAVNIDYSGHLQRAQIDMATPALATPASGVTAISATGASSGDGRSLAPDWSVLASRPG